MPSFIFDDLLSGDKGGEFYEQSPEMRPEDFVTFEGGERDERNHYFVRCSWFTAREILPTSFPFLGFAGEMLPMICDRSCGSALKYSQSNVQGLANYFIRKSMGVKSISVNSIEHVEWILLHVHLSMLHNRKPDIHTSCSQFSINAFSENIMLSFMFHLLLMLNTARLAPAAPATDSFIKPPAYAQTSLIRKIRQTLNEILMLREINIETRNESFKLNRKSNSNRV